MKIAYVCVKSISAFLLSAYKNVNLNERYFSPGEARKAFGLYLGCILRKISQPSADPACCDLVMKFLQHSSCSLRTPFLFTVHIRQHISITRLYCNKHDYLFRLQINNIVLKKN